MTEQPSWALRFKGHWVGIWNDRETAEFMRSRYKKADAEQMELVPMCRAESEGPPIEKIAIGPLDVT